MRSRHFLLVVLFAAHPSCKKSSPITQDASPTEAVGKIPMSVEPAVALRETTPAAEDAENQRTRPHPRPPKSPKPAEPEYPTAAAAPGKQGYVFSPYNNKLIDVRDIPPGTLVADPTYPDAEHKVFRVP